MSNYFKLFLASALTVGSLAGCNLGVPRDGVEDAQGYYYEGNIYDGVTSERLSDFTLTVSQQGETISAQVDANGHFMVGPVAPDHDYTVTIEAEDYREFFSVISGAFGPPPSLDGRQTFFYEAFLFPTNIESPEVNLSFFTPDGIDARPSGMLRLTPTDGAGLSGIHLGPSTTAGSIPGQVWPNDADRRQRTVNLEVEDGEVTVEAGELVYGVAYTGTVYGADGYTYENFFYVSGLEGDRTIQLLRLDPTALTLTANSLDISNINDDGEVVFTFNHPIEYGDAATGAQRHERIDDAFSISSPDYDDDGNFNVLVSNIGDDADERERGTRIRISGNTLTLSWDRDDSNFATTDEDDPIEYVEYASLDSIVLRPAGGRVDQEVGLDAMLGTNVVRVYIEGDAPTNGPGPIFFESVTPSFATRSVTYTFNQAIEFVSTANLEVMEEAIDNNFFIDSPDANFDAVMNILPASASATVQERGTSMTITGSSLTLSWDGTLETTDLADPINSISFGGLNSIQIRPVGNGSNSQATTLSTLIGTTVVTVFP